MAKCTMTRQQRRNAERLANKQGAIEIQRTSSRWMGRTKGQPYSRMKLVDVIAASKGKPAQFILRHFTKKRGVQTVTATPHNIDLFFRGLDPSMRSYMLGY